MVTDRSFHVQFVCCRRIFLVTSTVSVKLQFIDIIENEKQVPSLTMRKNDNDLCRFICILRRWSVMFNGVYLEDDFDEHRAFRILGCRFLKVLTLVEASTDVFSSFAEVLYSGLALFRIQFSFQKNSVLKYLRTQASNN